MDGERKTQRISLADRRKKTGKEDRMSEESVMRSLNTDAGRVRYIAGEGETKKTRSRGRKRKRRRKEEEQEDEAERFNELDGKGFLNSEGISNRAVPPAAFVSCDTRS